MLQFLWEKGTIFLARKTMQARQETRVKNTAQNAANPKAQAPNPARLSTRPQAAQAPIPASQIPAIKTEDDVRAFMKLLDHYYESGALSEDSYFEVKGEALKKLAHFKKQNFNAQTQQAPQPQQAAQQAQQPPAHNKKLYDAAEKAMEAAVRAAGSKLLGLKHDSKFQQEEQAPQMNQAPQPQLQQLSQSASQSAFEGATLSDLKKAKNDAQAMLEFIEESFNDGGLSEENYHRTRSQKIREIAKISAAITEYLGDDAEIDSEEFEPAQSRNEAGEEDDLNIFSNSSKTKSRQSAGASNFSRKRGRASDEGSEGDGGEDGYGAVPLEQDFEEEAAAPSKAARRQTQAKNAHEEPEEFEEDVPENFSFSKIASQHFGPRQSDLEEELQEELEGEPSDAGDEFEEPSQRTASDSAERELLAALGLKKNKHAMQELEEKVDPLGGEKYNFYNAKAKSGGGPDDLAGTFTPEEIAAEEKKEKEKYASQEKQNPAGMFFSKLKAILPGGGAEAQNTQSPMPQAAQASDAPPSYSPQATQAASDSATPSDSPQSTMKMLMEIEKLKAKTETFSEMKNATDERLGHLQESVGELRSMAFQRDSSQKELEGKVEKYLDMVESLEPQKFAKELDKRDKQMQEHQMRLEKIEAMASDLVRTTSATKSILESMGNPKHMAELNKEVAEKLSKMDSLVNRSQRTADDVDRAFVELGRKLEEFSIYAGKQEVMSQTVQDMASMLDSMNQKFDSYSTKDDLASHDKEIDSFKLKLSELQAKKIMQDEGRGLTPRLQYLQEQKDAIELLLEGVEEDFDARAISATDYENAKRSNLRKLSEIERQLREEYDNFTQTRHEELLKASNIAKNVCIEPKIMKYHEELAEEEREEPSEGETEEEETEERAEPAPALSRAPMKNSKPASALVQTQARKQSQARQAAPEATAPSAQVSPQGKSKITSNLIAPILSALSPKNQTPTQALLQKQAQQSPQAQEDSIAENASETEGQELQAPREQEAQNQQQAQGAKKNWRQLRQSIKAQAAPSTISVSASSALSELPPVPSQNASARQAPSTKQAIKQIAPQIQGTQQEQPQLEQASTIPHEKPLPLQARKQARVQPGVPVMHLSETEGEQPVFDLKKLLEMRLAAQGSQKQRPKAKMATIFNQKPLPEPAPEPIQIPAPSAPTQAQKPQKQAPLPKTQFPQMPVQKQTQFQPLKKPGLQDEQEQLARLRESMQKLAREKFAPNKTGKTAQKAQKPAKQKASASAAKAFPAKQAKQGKEKKK